MWLSVMGIFLAYALVFILFEDYDRRFLQAFDEQSDWNLLIFSIVVLTGLGWFLFRYASKMDERISRSQLEKENAMRRELTQNISHELKTPVASILGYADTMLENPDITPDERLHFLQRTKDQALKLAALIEDITVLNRIDYGSDLLPMERLCISYLVSDIEQETAMKIKEKHMTLRNYLPQDIIIHGNESLVYSIFSNLIDNSLKYAGDGTTIEIRAEKLADEWKFTFSDNGVGIPQEHLPRIFERFYRVDKGRSRSMGGTGLGLAIVKNAVMIHGGTIVASSGDKKGLTFTFTLKINNK